MKKDLLNILCCPNCGSDLSLLKTIIKNNEIESGKLLCTSCGLEYPIIRYVPHFVPIVENYANNFGFQWNQFRKTQLDSHTGQPIARERFFIRTGWSISDLYGKTMLDVGCGAGRYAEIALSTGANLVALDYSSAVDVCWQNLGHYPNLNVVQGDIYHLPFKPGCFDYVYCFGVLQHTPNVEKAFLSLPDQISSGGHLSVDVYPKLLLNILWPKYWLRFMTKRMPMNMLFSLVQVMVKLLLPVSILLGRIPLIGRKLRYAIPVANYDGVFPLTKEQLREWALLDTFDMFAPLHDHPQSMVTLKSWFIKAGVKNIKVFRSGFLIGRGEK